MGEKCQLEEPSAAHSSSLNTIPILLLKKYQSIKDVAADVSHKTFFTSSLDEKQRKDMY